MSGSARHAHFAVAEQETVPLARNESAHPQSQLTDLLVELFCGLSWWSSGYAGEE